MCFSLCYRDEDYGWQDMLVLNLLLLLDLMICYRDEDYGWQEMLVLDLLLLLDLTISSAG